MKNYKGVLYGAVIYSVIIGLIYVTLSILGLLSRWHVIDSTGSPLIYMMYLLYFRVGDEGIDWSFLGITSGVVAQMPHETEAVQRTLIIFIIYLALHTSLVILALYALCGVNNSCLGSRSCTIFFLPWVLVWIAIIILDITATTYYIIDAVNLRDVEGLLSHLEIANPGAVGPVFETMSPEVKYLPPIIMSLTAAKLFLFLLFNVAWVVAISRAGWAAATYHKYFDNSMRNYQNTMGTQNPAFDGFDPKNQNVSTSSSDHRSSVSHELPITSSAPPEPVEMRYNDTARVQGFAYVHNVPPQNTRQQAEDELSFRIQRPNTVSVPQERPSSIQVQHYERTTYRTEPIIDDDIEKRLSHYQESNGVVIRTVEPLKNDDIPEQQKSIIGIRVLPPSAIARSQSDLKHKPIPPPKPNNRYSMQPMAEMEEPILYRAQDRPTNPVKLDRSSSSQKNVPAELRNQFAFNYLDPNNQVPKRAFQNLSEEEETPNVPLPDYTLHFPPNNPRRTQLNSSFDEDYSSQWSQQNQQRY